MDFLHQIAFVLPGWELYITQMKAQGSQSSRVARLTLFALTVSVFTAWPANTWAQDVPLPERNPLRLVPVEPAAPAHPPHPPHPSERLADEWTAQDIQSAQDACAMMLDGSGIVYETIAPIREGVCGTPFPILLRSIGKTTPVAIEPPAKVTCGLAASLGTWSETVLQPAAEAHLGTSVISIRNVASYVCRNRYNMPDKRISQHALANALDMAGFTMADGRQVSVLDHWYETENVEPAPANPDGVVVQAAAPKETTSAEPAAGSEEQASEDPLPAPESELTKRALFLHELHRGGCALFGTVLGPLANDAHKDHFHFDQAERRHGNFCE